MPQEFGASSSVHKYFCEWQKAKVFRKIWKKGLGLYDDLQGISWQWQIADGSHTKSPIGLDAVGKSPVDRVKKWDKKTFINGREWYPVINHNNIRKYARYEGILQSHQETIN